MEWLAPSTARDSRAPRLTRPVLRWPGLSPACAVRQAPCATNLSLSVVRKTERGRGKCGALAPVKEACGDVRHHHTQSSRPDGSARQCRAAGDLEREERHGRRCQLRRELVDEGGQIDRPYQRPQRHCGSRSGPERPACVPRTAGVSSVGVRARDRLRRARVGAARVRMPPLYDSIARPAARPEGTRTSRDRT